MDNLNILFIDDEDITSSTIRRLQIVHQLRVTWVQSVRRALDELAKNTFDVIILDVMIPVHHDDLPDKEIKNEYGLETGILLLKRINNMKHQKQAIKIFCSARRREISNRRGLKMGKDYHYYFHKPYNTNELYELIKQLTNGKKK